VNRSNTLLAAALYLAFAVVTTWPVLPGIGTVLPGFQGDSANCVWALDLFWSSIVAGESPFETRQVYYPLGANLMHAGGAPTVALAAAPFWFWNGAQGIVAFFGVLAIAVIVIGGLGMRSCVQALTGNPVAALWCGLFYAGAPALVTFVGSPFYFRTAAAVMLPWGLAALVRFLETPRRARYLAGVSAVTWALLFTDYYMLFSFLVIVVVVGLVNVRPALVLPTLAGLAANVALAVVAIMLLPPLETTDFTVGGSMWSLSAANLGDLFVPGPLPEQSSQQIFRGFLFPLSVYATDWGPNPSSYFIGYGILALIIVGLVRRFDRRMAGILLSAVVLVLFACGTIVQWSRDGVPLLQYPWSPFHWVVKVPTLQAFDNPRCFMLGAATPILALAGVGLASLRLRARTIGMLAAAVFLLDYAQAGIPVTRLSIPRVYQELAAMPKATLLELPSGVTESKGGVGLNYDRTDNNEAMFWQAFHHQPRVAGYMSRVPKSTFEWFFHEPVIGDLLLLTMNDSQWTCYHKETRKVERLPDYSPEAVDAFIRKLDLGYLIFRPGAKQLYFMDEVARLLGPRITRREMIDDYGFMIVDRDAVAQAN
jgi:hypothetical protein